MATNLASPFPLNITLATVPITNIKEMPPQHDSKAPPTVSSGMVLHSDLNHDKCHFHWALPIWGLPLEQQHSKDNIWNEERRSQLQSQLLAQSTNNHQCFKQPTASGHKPTNERIMATPAMMVPPFFGTPIPLMPPDAQEGPEVVMKVIDEWFNYKNNSSFCIQWQAKASLLLMLLVPSYLPHKW